MSRREKFIETENRSAVATGECGVTASGYRVSLGNDEFFLELENSSSFTTLCLVSQHVFKVHSELPFKG